jgi:hypothetical protein
VNNSKSEPTSFSSLCTFKKEYDAKQQKRILITKTAYNLCSKPQFTVQSKFILILNIGLLIQTVHFIHCKGRAGENPKEKIYIFPRSVCVFCCREIHVYGPILGMYKLNCPQRHMNVEFGTEAAQFPENECINEIFLALYLVFH